MRLMTKRGSVPFVKALSASLETILETSTARRMERLRRVLLKRCLALILAFPWGVKEGGATTPFLERYWRGRGIEVDDLVVGGGFERTN